MPDPWARNPGSRPVLRAGCAISIQLTPSWLSAITGTIGPKAHAMADDITFQEVMLTARDAKATIEFDPETLNPRFSYGDGGRTHRVWFLDAVTAYNHLRAADKYRPAGYALWRLGAEDPSMWSSCREPITRRRQPRSPTITPTNDVNFIGHGASFCRSRRSRRRAPASSRWTTRTPPSSAKPTQRCPPPS